MSPEASSKVHQPTRSVGSEGSGGPSFGPPFSRSFRSPSAGAALRETETTAPPTENPAWFVQNRSFFAPGPAYLGRPISTHSHRAAVLGWTFTPFGRWSSWVFFRFRIECFTATANVVPGSQE